MGRLERQQQAREATRRAILDAALELFVKDGYAQVSIRKIAARIEYSPGAIYSYFPSKDDIFFALAEEGFRLLGARQLVGEQSDGIEGVRQTAWHLYQFSKDQPQYFALVFLDRHVPRVAREYERFPFMSEMRARIRARMQRCVDEGVFPSTLDAHVALRLICAPIFGIAALHLSHRLAPGGYAGALARDAIDTTIAGLRAGAAVHASAPPTQDAGAPRSHVLTA
jgi:AcrR family transcriptional regulator